MGLTMGQRKALTREMADRYRRAGRAEKSAMLDEFVELHGCTRHHAGWLLRTWGKTVFERRDGELVKIVVGQRRRRRRRPRIYDEQVVAALRTVWYLFRLPVRQAAGSRPAHASAPAGKIASSPWIPTRARSSRSSAPPPSTGCCVSRNVPCAYAGAPIPSRPRA